MTLKQTSIVILLVGVISFVGGRYSNTKPAISTTTEVVKDKEVVKNVKRTTIKTKDKDGNEKTITVVDSTTDSKSNEKSASQIKTSEVKNRYRVGVMLGLDKDDNKNRGIMGQVQLFGPVDMGVYYLENRNYGFTISVGF